MQSRSLAAWERFRARVAELGGTVLEPEWLGSVKPHRVRCRAGHETTARPNTVQQGSGICRRCAMSAVVQSSVSSRAATAWDSFRSRVAELGCTVLEPEWLGSKTPHRVRCARGHEFTARPAEPQAACPACPRPDPAAWGTFRARVAELGGTVLEPEWLGSRTPHRVRCAREHEVSIRPRSEDVGICRVCAKRDPGTAWDEFRARVAEMGGTVLEPEWLGSVKPHRVRCRNGHIAMPMPHSVARGSGICRTCVGLDPKVAEAAFRSRVAELGGTVLEPEWQGVNRPHRVRCANGHVCLPQPNNVRSGQGICRTCVGLDSKLADTAFRTRVGELGGIVLEPEWLGASKPHRVRCARGHEGSTWPTSVQQGGGICGACAGKSWDAFYVVTDDERGHVKLGITSGDPRSRLGDHRRRGFRTVVRVFDGLPGTVARDLERLVLSALRDAREAPVRGREYYDISALALIIDIVDNYPGLPACSEHQAKAS